MKRVLRVAARTIRPIYHWYRSPVGLLAALAFACCIALAAVGYERLGLIFLIVTFAALLPYKLRRNEDLARAANRRSVRNSESTSVILDRTAAATAATTQDLREELLESSTVTSRLMVEHDRLSTELTKLSGRIEATHELERSHAARIKTIFADTQLVAGLNHLLDPVAPLPQLDTWTLTADAADFLARAILRDKPQLMVETGSGASTVIAGLALARNGTGRVLALEHDKAFFEATSALISEHEIEDHATVLYCPLRTQSIAGAFYRWYDTTALDRSQPIDLLLIDGPPAHTNDQARYPALPELWDMITNDTQILVDDAGRDDETEVVARWQREFGPMRVDRLDHQRGSAVLRVSKSTADSAYSRVRSL